MKLDEFKNFKLEDICQHCKLRRGQYRINPKVNQVYNEVIYQFICNQCYDTLIMDI